MTFRNLRFARLAFASLALVGLLFNALAVQAANIWDGGGANNNWGTAANWDDNMVPTFPAPLTFAGATRLTPNNDLTNPAVNGVTFNTSAGAYVIGGNPFTLGTDMNDHRSGGIDQLDNDLQTINNNITLTSGQRDITTAAGAGGLTLNGAITRNPGAAVRFEPLGGPIKTTLTNTNGLLGGWATIQNPNPNIVQETLLFAKVDAQGNVVPYLDYTAADDIDGFAGETAIPAGTTQSSNLRWYGGPLAGSNLTAPAGVTNLNTFLYEQDLQQTVMIGAGNTLRFSDGGGIFRSSTIGAQNVESLRFTDGSITAGHTSDPATLYIWTNTTISDPPAVPNGEEANFTLHLSTTTITDNPDGGKVTVVSSGSGGVRTSAAGHTFSGGLYVNRGVWRAQSNVDTAFGAGPVYVASGAQAYVNADGIVPNDFYVIGTGIDEGAFESGAFRIAADGAVLNGNIYLTGNTRLGNRGAQASNAEFGDPALQGVIFNGIITGNFDFELGVRNDQGTLGLDSQTPTTILANSGNDWDGNTTFGRGRIRIGGTGEVIPHGPGKGNLTILSEGTSESILTLDSNTETINGLSSAVSAPGGDHSLAVITNSLAGEATLRVGANDATSTFAGRIMDHVGSVALTKIGSGTLTLTGDNAYTGNTRVDGGTLSISSPFLHDMADVRLSTGATLDLNFADMDTIESLYFNSTSQSTGTWGSLASTAANKSAFFTGTGLLNVTLVGAPLLLAGDYNGNGVVDAADYTIWRKNLGTANQLPNDEIGGTIGQDHYNQWKSNFGAALGSGAVVNASVPEPASLGLLLVAALIGLGVRSRRTA